MTEDEEIDGVVRSPYETPVTVQRSPDEAPAMAQRFPYETPVAPPETQVPGGNPDDEERAASKAGYAGRFDLARNFLATDRVPDSIFGYPVVSRKEDYTPEDIEFFREHPEAGGYYDLGEGSPEDGTEEGAPVQDDEPVQKNVYDTPLTASQETAYQAWRATLPKPLQYEGDYDLRGYWLDPETVKTGVKDGQHFTDRYKKPNHPTFSMESKYAVGDDMKRAGRWIGDRYVENPYVTWNRALGALGSGRAADLAKVFAAMSGEKALEVNGASSEEIINDHLARLIAHTNRMKQRRANPHNEGKTYTPMSTILHDSDVLSRYSWGSGPATNWVDAVRNEPKFGLISRKAHTMDVARHLIANAAAYLSEKLPTDRLPSDAAYYGDGKKALAPGTVAVPSAELKGLGPVPKGFKVGRMKGGK